MRKYLLLFLLSLFVLPVNYYCGITGKISGKIIDAITNEPLVGANVVITGTALGGTTDIKGAFYIINIPPGTYDVKASYLGYQTSIKKQVVVNVDRTTTVNFDLSTDQLQTSVVEVIADREGIIRDLTSSSEQISGDEIKKLPVEGVGDILALQVGMTKDAGGGLHLKGGRSSEIAYLVDGMPVTNPFGTGLAVDVQNNSIQQMEVISGTFNAEYGRAMSGVVNIITKEGGRNYEGTITAYTGDYLTDNKDLFFHIDDINPFSQKYLEGSFSGPVPLISNTSFFFSGRLTNEENRFYGVKYHTPSDIGDFTNTDPRKWLIQYSGDSSIVPMNPVKTYSFSGKISTTPFQGLKINYSFTKDYANWKNYDHSQKYNPEYTPVNESWGFNNLLSFVHTINPSLFHELRLSYVTTKYERSKYKDPYDPRYYDGIHLNADVPSDLFQIGLVDPSFSKNNTTTLALKYDITSQIHNSHLIKLGIELRQYEVEDEYFQVNRGEQTTGELQVDPLSSFVHNKYDNKPIEFGAYIQDKIEIEDIIVNAGIRFDYFDAKSYVPTDLTNPTNKSKTDPNAKEKPFDEAYKTVDPKMQFSPRLGFAFPISNSGSIHASYGQFFQIPELGRLYENPDFEVAGQWSSFIGNADLDAQRTTIYEIGLQQKLLPELILDATAYYKDIRNLASTKLYQTFDQDQYGQYTNFDYGSVWGLTLAFDLLRMGMFSSTVDYTYQVADGNASDPKQAFYDAGNQNESTKSLIPLDWDQRHVLNWVLNITGESWGLTTISRMQSGFPYTPGDIQLRNQARRKPQFNVDLRIYKNIEFTGVSTTFFIKVENLLDQTLNEYLPQFTETDLRAHEARSYINSLYDIRYNPASQPAPRLVKVGLTINI
jgi:outer membrane receptor protein involved in Fe transport